MTKTTFFKNLIKANRKRLIEKGFHPTTLTLWTQGKRFPSIKNAKRIAKIFGLLVDDFPVLRKTRE